eukprot:TRINITY_DN9257_c0_g1_i1.p1 TRINITY_DN9257_c0_g1~~TRINITY_DN9257_c0_g1_i1.p1  ORF type:complete len:225 (-),score=63.42 TRINITY_DN9257_c0_g1_i1:79-753(-)
MRSSVFACLLILSAVICVNCDFPQVSLGDNTLGTETTAYFDATSIPRYIGLVATPLSSDGVFYAATNSTFLSNTADPNVKASSGYYLTKSLYLSPEFVYGNKIYFSGLNGNFISLTLQPLVNRILDSSNIAGSGNVVEFEEQYFYVNLPAGNVTVSTFGRVKTCLKGISTGDFSCASADNGPQAPQRTVQVFGQPAGWSLITISGINAWRGSRGEFSFSGAYTA